MGRRKVSIAAMRRDRGAMSPEELDLLAVVLDRARAHVLSYPPGHILCDAAAKTLAFWGEPAPRKRGMVR
jgi:hypothetical protein